MFRIFKGKPAPQPAPEPRDEIKLQAEDVRYLAETLIQAHVRNQSLNKINKEAVRNAMMLAHALRVAGESYERELRAEALKANMKTEDLPDA